MAEFPKPSTAPSTSAAGGAGSGRQLIVVLQQASLETIKTKKYSSRLQGYELLNCDDHVGLHKKYGRDPASSRPDITHQLLLALLDSPLNKAGHLRIYIETVKHVLIEVSPHTRIPRTFKRFAGLMVQLLEKMRVRAADSSETLLKVIKNPITAHLPIGAPIYGLEAGAPLLDAFDLPAEIAAHMASAAPATSATKKKAGTAISTVPEQPVVFVIGAMSHGDISSEFIQKTYSISRYPLSAACAVGKLLNAFERAWGVL